MATKNSGSNRLPAVVVRAYSGVFFGYLKSKSGGPETFAVELEGARHIWSWRSAGLPRKALTVEDLAVLGAGTGTRISGAASISLADVKIIAEATVEAAARIEALPCL